MKALAVKSKIIAVPVLVILIRRCGKYTYFIQIIKVVLQEEQVMMEEEKNTNTTIFVMSA